MIRIGIFAFIIAFVLVSCNGQDKAKTQNQDKNLPKTDIKVKKEYDENGNLIRYDSAYSYFYSNIEGNKGLKDSVLNDFKLRFNQRYFFSNEPFFNDFFFQDSLLMYDFYKKDFFINRFRNNMQLMDSLFLEMDRFKDSFFNKQFKPVPNSYKL